MKFIILTLFILNLKCVLISSNNNYITKFGLNNLSEKSILRYHQLFSKTYRRSRNVLKYIKETKIKKRRLFVSSAIKTVTTKRNADPVFHGHPKTREEKWHEMFLGQAKTFDQNPSLIQLIHNITLTYLNDCTPVILYDDQTKVREGYLFKDLFKSFPVSFIHGYIDDKDMIKEPRLLQPKYECFHFIVFLSDVKSSAKVLGKQSESKVLVVARSSQWAVQEFLAGPLSRYFINLVVIGQSFKDDDNSVIVGDTHIKMFFICFVCIIKNRVYN